MAKRYAVLYDFGGDDSAYAYGEILGEGQDGKWLRVSIIKKASPVNNVWSIRKCRIFDDEKEAEEAYKNG